jgi:FG-GAP repeat protein
MFTIRRFTERGFIQTRGTARWRTCAALSAVLWMVFPAPRTTASAPPPIAPPLIRQPGATQPSAASAAASSSIFRLGNAAKPFGWSTAIGDFDSDGKPDFAVADRVAHRSVAGAYAYRIQLSLSSEVRAEVRFESTADAVTIRTVDVDHDNDLDLVVGHPLGGEAVRVWLNDGHGNFTAADVSALATTVDAAPGVSAADRGGIAALAGPRRRAGDDGVATRASVVADPSDRAAVVSAATCRHSASTLPRESRGPPRPGAAA